MLSGTVLPMVNGWVDELSGAFQKDGVQGLIDAFGGKMCIRDSLMDAETWLNANKAVELGFADDIMFKPGESALQDSFVFSRRAVTNSLMNKLQKPVVKQSAESLYERLNLLKY